MTAIFNVKVGGNSVMPVLPSSGARFSGWTNSGPSLLYREGDSVTRYHFYISHGLGADTIATWYGHDTYNSTYLNSYFSQDVRTYIKPGASLNSIRLGTMGPTPPLYVGDALGAIPQCVSRHQLVSPITTAPSKYGDDQWNETYVLRNGSIAPLKPQVDYTAGHYAVCLTESPDHGFVRSYAGLPIDGRTVGIFAKSGFAADISAPVWVAKHERQPFGTMLSVVEGVDDFIGGAISNMWVLSNSGIGGEVDFVPHATGELHGTAHAHTSANANRWVQIEHGRVHFEPNKFAKCEFKFNINDVSENETRCGFYIDANNYAYFRIAWVAGAAHIYMESNDGGVHGPYSADSGDTLTDGAEVILTVDLGINYDNGVPVKDADTEHARFFVNGILRGTSTLGAVPNTIMNIWFRSTSTSATDIIPTIDYIRWWQHRWTFIS